MQDMKLTAQQKRTLDAALEHVIETCGDRDRVNDMMRRGKRNNDTKNAAAAELVYQAYKGATDTGRRPSFHMVSEGLEANTLGYTYADELNTVLLYSAVEPFLDMPLPEVNDANGEDEDDDLEFL